MNQIPNIEEESIDIAIANLVFSGLSIAQMDKIPKWLLENMEKNKTKFKETLHQQLQKKDQLIRDLKCDGSDIRRSHKNLVELIKKERTEKAKELQKARHDIHTSLVAAVEGIDYYGWDENNQRMIKEKTLTIINSIFKE